VCKSLTVRYNLTVKDLHTYAVGQQQWVVHNCGVPQLGNQLDLYRAVGLRELNSIQETGRFLPGSNSLEARQFAYTADEALAYARIDPSKVAIMKATLDKGILGGSEQEVFDFSKNIDPYIFSNGVITVQPGAQSDLFHEALISIEQMIP
jgi:hypothetical protein